MPTYTVTRDMVQWCEVIAPNEDEACRLAKEEGDWEDVFGPSDEVDTYRVSEQEEDEEEDAQ
jgi:hypothetical protein